MNPVISWFEIPVTDFERGVRFYESVMGVNLKRETMGPMRMGMFPYEEGAATGGAVTYMEGGQPPGPMGSVVYLNGGEDLNVPLGRVETAGGVVLVPKTPIPPDMGFYAVFRDTEGNHVGLYSQQ